MSCLSREKLDCDHAEGGMYIGPEFQLGQVYDGSQENGDSVVLYRPVYASVVSQGSKMQPGSKPKHFYAGARFETHPSHVNLPVPPSHWTTPTQRSQSQPASPAPTSSSSTTLFGHSDPTLKSASFRGERLMDALMKEEHERNYTISFGSQGELTKSYESSNDETDELVKTAAKLSNDECNSQGSEMSPEKYQDITDQLKNLLKMEA